MRIIFFTLTFMMGLINPAFSTEAVSEDVARNIAQEQEPGTVRQTVIRKSERFMIYEFDIAKEDGQVMRVSVNGRNGAVMNIDAVEIPVSPQLLEGDAKAVAIKHLQGEDMTIRKPEVVSIEYTTYADIPAYLVKMKLNFVVHEMFIDANSGKILSSQKIHK